MSAAASYETRLAALDAPLPAEPALGDLLRVATLAASGHNTQPWRFRPRAGGVDILPDLSRRTPVVDPDDHHLWASLGCAAQTLVLAARSRGIAADAGFAADADGERLAVDLAAGVGAPADEADLAAAISRRRSTRALYDGRPIPPALVARMIREAARHGVELLYLSETQAVEDVLAVVLAGNTAQIRDRAFVAELKSWLRWNERHALATGDGLFAGASGNPSSPTWLGPILFDLVFREGRENDKVASQIRSSSGLVVLVAGTDDPAGWAAAGRAYTAAALAATAAGATLAFVNQCVEVPAQRAALRALLGLGDRRPNLVLRIGYGPPMPRSPRRALGEVMMLG
ncbi:Acg family FMN-binding oxidoreductase [Salinarimonas ramus]|uniref:Tat pathway signal protein n=1 Tax=Salinarimonas ramus TaxID=690164 RepID=A0A917QH73_9HYPH|nr:nitroreductase family protein [Salinarimonas ramus]GGK49713.1 Tat pathway signal protein [Salinarimonas ramus]